MQFHRRWVTRSFFELSVVAAAVREGRHGLQRPGTWAHKGHLEGPGLNESVAGSTLIRPNRVARQSRTDPVLLFRHRARAPVPGYIGATHRLR
jgi:hypothetical protein